MREIFVSAGESSSDIHAAHLVTAIKKLQNITTYGLGGDALAAVGTVLMMHNREFSVGGGPLEILSRWPKRTSFERAVEQRILKKRPAAALLVDSGEINLRLASLFHFFGVPVIYFIPPKVWVWRASRIEQLAQHAKLVLSILPFEEPIYREWQIPFEYIGNPLLDEVDPTLTEAIARKRLSEQGIVIEERTPIVTILPGSRFGEIKNHSVVFANAIAQFVDKLPPSESKPAILIPAAQNIEVDDLRSVFEPVLKAKNIQVHVVKGFSHECLKAARVALVKSGTSTLEAALLGTPMVLAYQVSKSSAFLFKTIVRYSGYVGLVNLFLSDSVDQALGWEQGGIPVVPELILEKCNAENIAQHLAALYQDGAARETMLKKLGQTRARLAPPAHLGLSPFQAAARACVDLFESKNEVNGALQC